MKNLIEFSTAMVLSFFRLEPLIFFDEFLAADSCDVDNPPGTTGPKGFS
jgi:hypothetical protein